MIRKASLLDINGIRDLCVEAWDGAPYRHIPLNDVKLRSHIRDHIKQDSMLALVSEQGGEVVGMLGAYINRMDMCDALSAHCSMLYASEGGDGPRLLRRYVKWAKKLNAALIGFDQSYGRETEKVSRIALRAGFQRVGGLHLVVCDR